ncbi:MAG: ABC transporter substrate-binding protein [Mesorhizobium sp.]|nr:ABC transporter substrate-binding protein [Mesorhizobium sp.]RWP42835.1 MAG: ABC transporter substrate-binding protein [Mesorhizobium sp.]TIM25526.1 MAG: ABC transporter substrate-binding protein [Mesorhizobium sp.]TIM73436.1 MAG: ABC transporter substrate-binding protein [Mesorhizobium sp.]
MQVIQNRRRFLAGMSAIGAVGLAGGHNSSAENALLDTTTVRFTHTPATCNAPLYLAEELLRADGFTGLTYVDVDAGVNTPMKMANGEADFGFEFASAFVIAIDAGAPVKVLGGLHAGCYELFAHEGITSVLGLKGKRIGVGQNLKSDPYLFVSAMATHVGLDPRRDIDWVISAEAQPMQLFIDGKVDAFLGFGTECQELRARKIGHSIVSGVLDPPWSQYFCCMLASSTKYVEDYPVATKRVLRAIFRAADLCTSHPERAARLMVDRGYAAHYEYALQALREIRYSAWREFDPEDSIRFFSLRLHENRMIESSPRKIIANGTDWRFVDELKRELKT